MGLVLVLAFVLVTTALAIRGLRLLHADDPRPQACGPATHPEPISRAETNAFLQDLYRTDDLVDRLRREPRA